MSKCKVYFADLTHTAQGISASTFPLGISFVVSYAKSQLNNEFDFRLFKFPEDLEKALKEESPTMLCCSNYSWNFELVYAFATLVKQRSPQTIVILGGPNFPTDDEEKIEFFRNRPCVDFYIQQEGEIGFVSLAQELLKNNFNVQKLKEQGERIVNTVYYFDGNLVSGPLERIDDVNTIPSPYLSGVLDEFFNYPLVPMIETTRGCPFSCTFCSDAAVIKNKIHRYDYERTKDELYYIAEHVKDIDELIITDLNFAMYQEDIEVARLIAQIQKEYHFPIMISASAGKNKPKRVIEAASILDGSWTLGFSIQSNDPEVLKAIRRSNISSSAYEELMSFGNTLKNSKTHSEIILGMPADTKEKHFNCLRFVIDNNVNSVRMFQAMLLVGTEMANRKAREGYGLITKFRTIPGCVGIYEFFGEKHSIAEIEEIIVGSKVMPIEDYLECRIMNLIVETFHNNAIFDEVFSMVHALGCSHFDCLLYLKEHSELYSPTVNKIMKEFVIHTTKDLYDSFEEAQKTVLTPEVIEKYIGGELGINELLIHRALLFMEFEDITSLLFKSVKESLREKNKLTSKIEGYLSELEIFTVLRKKGCLTDTKFVATHTFNYDFEAIRTLKYKIDPSNFPMLDEPIALEFSHDDSQKRHLANQAKVYVDTPMGLGRLIQRSNLKLMYRSFKKCTESHGGERPLATAKLKD